MSNQHDLNDSLQEDRNFENQSLNNLIGDFNFSFDRVLKLVKQVNEQNFEPTRKKTDMNLLSNQKSMKSSQSYYNTLEPNKEALKFNSSLAIGSSLIVVKEELKRIFEKSHKVLAKGVNTQGVIMYFNSSEELQRHSFRVIKNLKENFQKSKGQYVKKINQDIDNQLLRLNYFRCNKKSIEQIKTRNLRAKVKRTFHHSHPDELENLREAFNNSDMAILEKVTANSC